MTSVYVCNRGRVRFVTEYPEDAPLWLRLHVVADRALTGFEDAIAAYRRRLQAQLPLGDLERALDFRDPLAITAVLNRLQTVTVGKAARFLDDPLEGITARYRDIILEGAKEAMSLEPEMLQNLPYLEAVFNVTNPYAVSYASDLGSQLIQGVDAETRRAVQGIIAQALDSRTSLAPAEQAKLIRNVVGLSSRQADSVARYRRGLRGVPASIDRRTERFANRLHRQRATTIARTETIRAANAGVRLVGTELSKLPMLRTTDIQYVWITTPDDRLCERCRGLNDQVVGFSEAFQDEPNQAEVDFPPLHPRCRCAIARRPMDVDELERRLQDFAPQAPELVVESPLTSEQLATMTDIPKPMDMRTSGYWDYAERAKTALRSTENGRSLYDALKSFSYKKGGVNRLRGEVDAVIAGSGGSKRAKVLVDVLRTAPKHDKKLYRGMSVKGNQTSLLERYQPGQVMDLNLSSFSSDPKVAADFAKNTAKRGTTRVKVELLGQKNAMPIMNVSDCPTEWEYLASGRFKVLERKKSTDGGIILRMEQVMD